MQNKDFDLVWGATVDAGKWAVEVTRTAGYEGTLRIYNESSEEVYRAEVPLAFDAIFGPDVSDVANWQSMTLTFIDSQ
jgi:hypothetical protein